MCSGCRRKQILLRRGHCPQGARPQDSPLLVMGRWGKPEAPWPPAAPSGEEKPALPGGARSSRGRQLGSQSRRIRGKQCLQKTPAPGSPLLRVTCQRPHPPFPQI